LSLGSPFGLPAHSLNSVLLGSLVCQAALLPERISKEEEAAKSNPAKDGEEKECCPPIPYGCNCTAEQRTQ